MSWLAYHFTVDPVEPGSEILMAVLSGMNFESFTENENGFIGYIRKEDAAQFQPGVLNFEDFRFSFTVSEMADTNWNQVWEKNFDPVLIGNQLSIRAAFHTEVKPAAIDILITPKMSFGTGHHHTTQLMCQAMLEMDFTGKRVLDMGCGTGILAILAAKRGATDILAIDIDEWPVENSRENCAANNAGFVDVMQGDIDVLQNEKPFDVILANINRNVLLAHMPVYAANLAKKGTLLLSGFLRDDVPALETAVKKNGLTVMRENQSGEWMMMLAAK